MESALFLTTSAVLTLRHPGVVFTNLIREDGGFFRELYMLQYWCLSRIQSNIMPFSPAAPYLGGGKDALRKKKVVCSFYRFQRILQIIRSNHIKCSLFFWCQYIFGSSMFGWYFCKIEVYTNIRRHVQKCSGSPPIGIICSHSLESKLFLISIIW